MTARNQSKAFEMPMFRTFIPRALRPWIYVLIAISFQITGGVYLGSLNEMIGSRSLMREDLLMCLYANLAGMAIYFPLLFRMKFRFTNKTLLLTSALAIIGCNFAATRVENLPILWTVCFISGIFKIQGTFECMSNIQLWITPKRDFTVFFPVLHIIILGCIELSDLLTVYLTYYFSWEAMHRFVETLFAVEVIFLITCIKHVRIFPKMKLYGIDWIGALLWSLLALLLTYIFNYGDWCDWYRSPVIQRLTGAACITAACAVHRMMRIRHPYYEPKMWTYRYLAPILILIAVVEIFLATENVLEKIFHEDAMRYSALTESKLDWWVLGGVTLGAMFALLWMKVLRFNYYKLLAIGMACLAAYLAGYYFLMTSTVNIERLYFPALIRGFSYSVLSATFMQCLNEIMTFRHFFQALSIFNMMHMFLGGVIGGALYARGMRYYMADNIARYSQYVDSVATTQSPIDMGQFMNDFIVRMELTSVKQIYGWVLYGCIGVFLLFLLWDRPYVRSTLKRIPRWHAVSRQVKRVLTRITPYTMAKDED